MPYLYILQCSDGSYYTGSTWDLERRLWEHQNGLGAKHTAKRLPVQLVYCEMCERIEDAYIREKQIQGWSRNKKQALMAGDSNLLHRLAECRNASHSQNAGFDSAQPTVPDSAQPTTPEQPEKPGAAQPTSSGQPETSHFAQPTGSEEPEIQGAVSPNGSK
ncbi:GIY-YIG nuclease family protein [Methylomonas sp. MED-D]|uniref:GIY-YIG nuclease family protein n=1 Tax=unclassified Methylomonas TaxID=2608980 RepID=UPI0028A49447|nr:GIY-YIG nuclease family protein [Methylomonas sp. MV1]MDT4331007.1 GIY-YIG nuclease family protein [Methylomonas sp. MV1]